MDAKGKLKDLIDFLQRVILQDKKTGRIEIHISQGGITRVDFKEKVI
jgi:hypothetical protein